MKIKKTRNGIGKIRLVFFVFFALLVVALLSYLYINQTNLKNNGVKDFKNNDSNDSQEIINNSNISPKTPVGNQPSAQKNDGLVATITYVKQEHNLLKIGVDIEIVSSNGECTLSLFKDGEGIDYSVGIQPLSSSSTCKGFEIPIIELSPGSWKISITIKAEDKNTVLTDSVIIE